MSEFPDSPPERRTPTLWQQNHGNFLLCWLGIIVVLGMLFLAFPGEPKEELGPRTPSDFGIPLADDQKTMIVQVRGKGQLPAGDIKIALYDSAETFRDPTKAVLKDSITHDAGGAIWLVPVDRLPPKFGIAVYCDADGNGELTKSAVGMPLEPYGFSKNQKGLFGAPPAFEDSLIERRNETWRIEILID